MAEPISNNPSAELKTKQPSYAKKYRSTPHGAAACAWNRLTSRAGAKYGHRKCYARIEVRMTRADFMMWAISAYEVWFREHPGITPSVDRIDPDGHYEIGNLRLIPLNDNRQRASCYVNRQMPEGLWHCGKCDRILPVSHFYKIPPTPSSPRGLSGYCKDCHRAYQNARYAAKHQGK